MSSTAAADIDLRTLGCEIGSRKSYRLDTAIRAAFALAAMIAAAKAGAQGAPCLTNCGDHALPPIIVTPGGSGGITPTDPCPGNNCGPGNDVPPDQGGATGPQQPTVCERFLNLNPKPRTCSASIPPEMPTFGAGCNFHSPAFNTTLIAWEGVFFNACNLQPQCYWNLGDENYCNQLIREKANEDCVAQATRFHTPLSACVDKTDTFMSQLVNSPRSINMMTFQDIRNSVECTRWRAGYHEACR